MRVCVFVCVHFCACLFCACVYVFSFVCLLFVVHVCVCVCVCVYVCVCVHLYVCLFVCINIVFSPVFNLSFISVRFPLSYRKDQKNLFFHAMQLLRHDLAQVGQGVHQLMTSVYVISGLLY